MLKFPPRMKKKNIRLIGAALGTLLAAATAFLLLSRKTDFSRLRQGKDFNVILITMDTTRADRLGCYGFAGVRTPTIDGYAERGIRFTKCFTTTPLTLPAHTSILTGTLPPFHGIRDNGGFVVPPEIRTMAEVFKDRGYATSAFVAAYVLDSKWGLNQGFDTYFDKFDLSKFERISLGTVQRPANEVLDEALSWLEKNKDRKFFTWIHLYDPHTPYEPPPPFKTEYAAHPYAGEIAFADSQLARLDRFLETNGLDRDSFLVLVGDHGESLGEHEEGAHGFFVYQAAVHVPLIFVTPFPKFRGRTSPRVASVADVLPTICEMTGIPPPARIQGESLVAAFDGRGGTRDRYAYSETFYPRYHYGWSELKAVQNERYKLILAPVPELYDVVRDPAESKNLVYLEKKVFTDMSLEAERFIERSGRDGYEIDIRKVDEETREKLSALGYVGAFIDSPVTRGNKPANPKEKIGIFNDLSRAREAGMEGQAGEAIAMIRKIIAEDPEISEAHFTLGNIYFKERQFAEAAAAFRKCLEIKPDDTFAVMNIANCHIALKEYDEAENFVLDRFRKGFSDPQLQYLLGNMNFVRKKYDKALAYFRDCLAANRESASSHNAMAAIYIETGETDRADEHIREALRIDPTLTNVHYNLAQLQEIKGLTAEAEASYLREIEIAPGHFKALFNLSRIFRGEGNEERELEYLEKCREAEPSFPLSYFYIARIHLNRGEKYAESVAMVRKGIDLGPAKAELPLGYFLLADLYNRLGDARLAQEYARKGREAAAAL